MPENTTGYGTASPSPDDAAQATTGKLAEPAAEHVAAGRAAQDPTVSPASTAGSEPAGLARPEVATTSASTTPAAAGPSVLAGGAQAQMNKISKTPDRIFSGMTLAAGLLIVAIVAFVGIFLVGTSAGSLALDKANFLFSTEWSVDNPENMRFGILGLLWTTTYVSVIALILAVPVAIGVALLITQYIRGRGATTIGFMVDLLAAVPSVIYGLWGVKVLGPALLPLYKWLGDHWGAFPLFHPYIVSAGNILTAGLVLAIMILPIITAITRDVFAQTPRDHIEAALALGATRWEVIRTAVLPYGRSGLIAASMLGLGRALGETVAVMLILSTTTDRLVHPSLLQGGSTFAAHIASSAGEFDTVTKTGAYIAAGLVLFAVTFAVNTVARLVADSGKAKS